jgi:MOSC N-terminal beta barrel domain
MVSSYTTSPLIIPATGITVLATILATSKYSPIARPFQTVCSRVYLSLLLFTKALYNKKDKTAVDDETVVTSLYKYPVKSLRTIPCDEVVFDGKGIVGDRRYMLVVPAPRPIYGEFLPNDPTHRFITQRQCPILARVVVVVHQTSDGKNQLQFSTDVLPNDMCTVSTEADTNAPIYKSTLWGDIVTVQDMGDAIAAYIQKIIALDETAPDERNKDIRLAMQYIKDTRTANDKFVPPVARSLLGKNPSVHLGDGFPMYVSVDGAIV